MALNPKAVNESSVEGSGSSVEYKHREYLPAEVIRCKEKKGAAKQECGRNPLVT